MSTAVSNTDHIRRGSHASYALEFPEADPPQRPGIWRSWGDMVVGLLYYAVVLAFVVGAAYLIAMATP